MKKRFVLALVVLLVCLILSACGCKHQYVETFTTKTYCSTTGIKTFTCRLCGSSYMENIPMTGHSYESKVTKEASCAEPGVITYTCTMCHDSYTESFEAVSHSLSEAVITKEPSCTEEGERSADCIFCGEQGLVESIPMTEHTYTSKVTEKPTCVSAGTATLTCSVCGDTKTEAITDGGHSYVSKVTANPTCAATGTKTLTCSACGNTKTESIEKIEHNYTPQVTTEPTCITVGTTTFTCSGCGDAWTESIPALGHSYTQEETTPATCTEAGQRIRRCVGCGDVQSETLPALGHIWAEATCTEAKYCTACGQTEGVKLGHTTSSGICDRCGNQVENEEKQKAIAEENKRHEYQIAIIESTTDSNIELNNNTIDRLTRQYGLGYVGYSESYYQSKADDLIDEVSQLQRRVAYLQMDTSNANRLEIMRLESEIADLEQEVLLYLTYAEVARLKEENEALERNRSLLIAEENRLHRENLQQIENTYGANY